MGRDKIVFSGNRRIQIFSKMYLQQKSRLSFLLKLRLHIFNAPQTFYLTKMSRWESFSFYLNHICKLWSLRADLILGVNNSHPFQVPQWQADIFDLHPPQAEHGVGREALPSVSTRDQRRRRRWRRDLQGRRLQRVWRGIRNHQPHFWRR